jgi:hypothetical protein
MGDEWPIGEKVALTFVGRKPAEDLMELRAVRDGFVCIRGNDGSEGWVPVSQIFSVRLPAPGRAR